MADLKTTVEASVNGKPCGTYTVSLSKSGGKTILIITPCKGTGGHWEWYLETLLLDGLPSDALSLDWGQGWGVIGMLEVYREILNEII